MSSKIKILVCGILPPPNFGHSMMYKMLMESSFIEAYDVTFLNLHFWTYGKHKKVTADKIFKMVKYLGQYVYLIMVKRPKYVLFNMSFDRMPFLKDYLFCAIGRLLGCRIVLHDMGQYLPELETSSQGLFKKLINHLLYLATAIIVMGEKVKREYQAYLPAQKLVVVPGTVEETHHLQVPRHPKDNPKEIRVLYFSFLSTTKGVWTAIEAIPQVIQANPNIKFTFAGPVESQELLNNIKAFVDQKNLGGHFDYVGYVESAQKRTEYFRNADIFIFPTLRDVFGLVLLHAMAEGIPIIASREGTIPEIVQDGINGFLFTKGDSTGLANLILCLSNNEDARKDMALANRSRFVDHYAPKIYGQNMVKAFAHIETIE